MRKFAPLPKSILLVEILGMGLLTLAWLSLNQYVQLPAPIASPTAALVMLFAGIVLMIPAALVVMWRVAQIVAPQLTHSLRKVRTSSDMRSSYSSGRIPEGTS